MTRLLYVVLVGVWVVVLVPPALRSRSNGRPSDSIGSFNRHLSVLSRAAPSRRSSGPSLARSFGKAGTIVPTATFTPRPVSSVQRRRRDVFVALLGLAVATSLGAVVLRGPVLVLAGLAWVGLVAYVALLLRIKREAAVRSFRDDAGAVPDRLGPRTRVARSLTERDPGGDWDAGVGPHQLDSWDDWDLVDAR